MSMIRQTQRKQPMVTIELSEYENLKQIAKCTTGKIMYVNDIHYQQRHYYCFTDVQKELAEEIQRLSEMNKDNYNDYLKSINDLKGRTFKQKLKNLFK